MKSEDPLSTSAHINITDSHTVTQESKETKTPRLSADKNLTLASSRNTPPKPPKFDEKEMLMSSNSVDELVAEEDEYNGIGTIN